ncbi:hypothetical protein DID78_06325 [Candidatus Marinamargulisbacteria bacterium SCGC AG-343-D04]|nr:hypothetical protein DID78_06325 [Candidatus Marinamargulisbacteria bacterium SCGC AG-343-D04]
MRKVILLSSGLLLILVIGLTLHTQLFFSRTFTIMKSHWPAWDLFEYQVSSGLLNSRHTVFKNFPTYEKALDSFMSNQDDAALVTIFEAIYVQSKGIPVKIVLLLDYTLGGDQLLVQQDITSLPSLKGKKIGAEYGTISHFTSLKALEKAGLSSSDILFDFDSMPNLIKKFKNGDLDALGSFEPFSSKLTSTTGSHAIFSSKEIPRAICDVLIIKESSFSSASTHIKFWRKQWRKITNAYIKNPNLIKDDMNQFYVNQNHPFSFNTNGIYLTGHVENIVAFNPTHGYLLDSLKDMMNFMIEHNVIDKPVPLEAMLTLYD